MILQLSLLGLILILTFIYYIGKYNENYWKKRGVKFYEKNKVTGPFWDLMTKGRPLFQVFNDIYKLFPHEPAVGFGSLLNASVYVKDTTNANYVLHSPAFTDRGIDYNEGDLLSDNILFMSGTRWKMMRQKMSPLFTSAKLKNMYYIMDKSAQDFVDYLQKNPTERKGNTFDTLSTFCCAAIGATVFGINTTSTFDSPFLELGKSAFKPSFMSNLRFSFANLSPWLFKQFKVRLFKLQYEEFFIGAMKQVFRKREEENIKKHDFADICLSIQKGGTITREDTNLKMEPTDELLAAQGFFFFSAGVEPTATGMFGALIEIGKHPDVQKKVQEEIDHIFAKYNGELNFDAIVEMQFLDQVLSETLRMYPPIGFLTRRCIEDTVLPVGNIKIEKGTKVFTPIYEYHHDPQYYKNPEKFVPERFSEDMKPSLAVTYQPFGFGSRICIGARYARLQVKAGLAHVLRNFDLKTHIGNGGIKYTKDLVQVRMKNVNVEFIERKKI